MFGKNRKTEVKLYYYNYPNIGDILNVILIEELFKMKVIEEQHTKAEMMAIGSVLDRLLEDGKIGKVLAKMNKDADRKHTIHVWGTGLMYDCESRQKFIRPVKVHALRGALSAEIVSKIQGRPCNCVLADPGLLASKLLKEKVRKKYEIGIIPHYVDAEEEVIVQMKEYYSDSTIIDVKAEPLEVLKTIAQCRTVLSTSLHGLIIADSFNIPNQWCICSERILGDGFKFRDYYSAFGVEATPVDLRKGEFPSVESIRSRYQISQAMVNKKQKELMKSFPYNKGVWAGLKVKGKKWIKTHLIRECIQDKG